MNKNRNVILVTSKYPYSYGEQFIETEIKYWSSLSISILPTQISDTIRDTSGVEVDSRLAENIGAYRKIDISSAVLTILSPYLIKELISKPKLLISPSKLKDLIRFEYLTQRFISAFERLYNGSDLSQTTIYTYWFSWSSCALSRLKANYDFKLITRCHRADLYSYAQPSNYMPYRKNYAANIDEIHSISLDGIKYLEEEYNIPNAKIKLSRLGVQNASKFTTKKHEDIIHFVSVSYVKPVKRVLLIAEMINNFALNNPNKQIRWTHFGDGVEFEKLKLYVSDFKANVELMGMTSNHDILEFYANNYVDIFVNLSLSEGVPVSIMEAISFGIPVIATDSGGVNEIVNEDVGALVELNFEYDLFERSVSKLLSIDRDLVLDFFDANYNAEYNYTRFVDGLNCGFRS
ncbi:glycosyltransferase [Vibrio coralliirubri]|uniref:glycosyltransferase n=1 Tax=Vibrio coralliirubri TaxID=1516159 RepID=UPI000769FA54|nr:glycosyltransferase [Vibrio coralliirubri]